MECKSLGTQFLSKTILIMAVTVFVVCSAHAERYKPEKSMPKIVGGEKAEADAWPWMVALVDGNHNYYDQFCAGALIDAKWVATAAHCVNEPPFQVLLGIDNLDETGVRINAKNVFIHPRFFNSDGLVVPDIALIELETEATQTPIPLYDGRGSLEGVMATIIGWGATDASGSMYPYDLMEARVPIVDQAVCENAYYGIITDWEVCAGYEAGGVDTCAGDSGGPLMINDGGAWKLAGVTTWGEGCAQPGFYGVYARISSLYDWISRTMNPMDGDFDGNGKLGLGDSIGILQVVSGQ